MSTLVTRLYVLGLILIFPLTGCGEEKIPVGIQGYNHIKDESIEYFSVNDAGGDGMPPAPYGGEGGETCCIAIPKHWHPGMKATVKWGYGWGAGETGPHFPPQQAVVEIPEYTPETLGEVQAHFYPGHRVKVVVSTYRPGHPAYPLSKEDLSPWTLDERWIKQDPNKTEKKR